MHSLEFPLVKAPHSLHEVHYITHYLTYGFIIIYFALMFCPVLCSLNVFLYDVFT